MCTFFSLVSDGAGNIFYFDWELREKVLRKEMNYTPDSHTSIADYHGFKGAEEDTLNKWEYNPLTGAFKADQINTFNDKEIVEKRVRGLDFGKIVPALVIKPIVHPFRDIPPVEKPTEIDLKNLKAWDSVRASVRDSVGDSVRDSVWDSVRASVGDSVRDSVRASVWDSVGDSVWDSVRDSVRDSVGASVWDSVRDSVWDSVGASVRDSVWAYIGSYFLLHEWKGGYPFQPAVDLWMRGLVPSYDGKIWRNLMMRGGCLMVGKKMVQVGGAGRNYVLFYLEERNE